MPPCRASACPRSGHGRLKDCPCADAKNRFCLGDPGGIADFAKKNGAKFNIGWDEGQAISGTYQPPTMPTAYIIDKNGIVRYVHAGFRKGDEVEIDAHVAELLK